MKRTAFFRPFSHPVSSKHLVLLLGAAAWAFMPQISLAQHGGGGHAGGGGGGHVGGGMSSAPHFSNPAPAPHVSAPPAPHVAPQTHFVAPPAAYVPPRAPQPVGSVVNNQVVHPMPAPARAPVAVGFPAPEPSQVGQANSAVATSIAPQPGAAVRFFGEGHEIFSEPTGVSTASSSSSGSKIPGAFRGPAGFAPASTLPPARPPIVPPHIRVPIIVAPGFGPFGFGGFGYGFGYGFGSPFFFGDPFLGFQYGSVFQPCDGFGLGFQCAPYNAYYNYEQPFTSTMIAGPETDTETQSQQIFSPYSPGYPPPQENNNGPSANEYVLYLKDGSVYVVNDYWYSDGKLVYSTGSGEASVDLESIDMQKTLDVNAKRGLVFTLRPAPQPSAPTDQNSAAPPDQNAPAPAPQP